MNQKIYNLLIEQLKIAFNPIKYQQVKENLKFSTNIEKLPWTPVRYEKFKASITDELGLSNLDFSGTIEQAVNRFDNQYLNKFFGSIWEPAIGSYNYSGWQVAEEIANSDPQAVLDVGCGYHPFKDKIPNITGIDPYNTNADYMVDILDFTIENESFDHIICFGSINFNSFEDVEERFKRVVELLKPEGKIYFRANPGIQWPTGPYVDIFPWSFEIAYDLSKKYGLHLENFKQDANDRLYFVFQKKPRKLDQGLLNRYFEKNWTPSYRRGHEGAHLRVAQQIKDTEWLLDVGCGYNPFKQMVKNVVGIDPAFDTADIKTTIEEYKPDRLFDAAACFGSINFGNKEDIKRQIAAVVACLTPTGRIFWRVNPGHKDHLNEMCKGIDFYPWSLEELDEMAHDFGFEQRNASKELNDRRLKYPDQVFPDSKRFSTRLYAEWHRVK
jgi:SAM-dependent methyltransferase